MEKIIRKVNLRDSETEDLNFWLNKSAEERLDALQVLRENYIILFNKQTEYDESRKALRRVYRIVKQTQC